MSVNPNDGVCGGCGSTLADREKFAAGADDVPLSIGACPYCNTDKCCMCDMGDDVNCGNCPDED